MKIKKFLIFGKRLKNADLPQLGHKVDRFGEKNDQF